ncbi:MAG: helix-turn-helix transcriptional regulator [Bacilli bacterium]|nr:helix-turn-helix transcriptional regulator [Bacilli bacterium]
MKNNISYSTGTLIEKLRKESNLTLQKLAEALHVSKAAISQWEGGSGIKTEMLYELSKFFSISVHELINGKLDNESNTDYWKRNYNLSNYEFDENISENNLDKLENYYRCIKQIKKEFYRLLPSWSKDKLIESELEEFNFLKDNYFTFDNSYYTALKNGMGTFHFMTEKEEKDFVSETYAKFQNKLEKELDWELSKLYGFKGDYKGDGVCESRSTKALELYLSILPQVLKDALFMANLEIEEETEQSNGLSTYKQKSKRPLTDDEIEQRLFFKIMINNGCHYMQKRKWHSYIDEENINMLEGTITECDLNINEHFENDGLFVDFGGLSRFDALQNWKFYSYEEYEKMIDKKETERLFNLLNYKNDNPLKYYEYISE